MPRALVLREVLRVGQEHALADDVGERVQVAVDRLEAEVGHAHRVGVRVDQGERDAAPPVLAEGSGFLLDEAISFCLEIPGHAPSA